MAIAPERTQKRHVREKATIDHLAQNGLQAEAVC